MENMITRPIDVITKEINFYKNMAGEAVLEIGKRLNEAKAQLEHGEWQEWLEKEVEFSEVSAQRFMRLAREYSNPSPVMALGASKALILLALPEEEREVFMNETHTINGEEKTVSDMSKRELEKVVKERDEAIKREELAKKDVSELEEKLKYKNMEAEEAARQAEEAQRELEELKSKPVEVATMPLSDEDIEEIKEAAKEQYKKEIEKLKNKIDKLSDMKRKADEQVAKATEEIEKVKAAQNSSLEIEKDRNKKLTERINELDKKLEVSSNSDMTEFKVYFESAKQAVNKMLEISKKEGNEKLTMALKAFCEAVIKNLEG